MSETLWQTLVREINESERGAIPFVRYMELALYHEREGYYQQERPKLGRAGDFFTHAHVGQLYGRVLAGWLGKLREKVAPEEPWTIVEMGAGDGRLTEQMIQGLVERADDPSAYTIYLLERSHYHRHLQQERLAGLPIAVTWVESLAEIPNHHPTLLYTNELVDAFPIHRIKQAGAHTLESFVTLQSDQLIERWEAFSTEEIKDFITEMSYDLQEGQIVEVNLAAKKWLTEVAGWLQRGFLLTIDYGDESTALLQRREGTLRGYHQHQLSDRFFDQPGQMDLTSHVNFSSLMKWGEQLDLHTLSYETQTQFLLHAGIMDHYPKEHVRDPFSPPAKQIRAIQQLIHPDAMGEVFRVLLQGKGT